MNFNVPTHENKHSGSAMGFESVLCGHLTQYSDFIDPIFLEVFGNAHTLIKEQGNLILSDLAKKYLDQNAISKAISSLTINPNSVSSYRNNKDRIANIITEISLYHDFLAGEVNLDEIRKGLNSDLTAESIIANKDKISTLHTKCQLLASPENELQGVVSVISALVTKCIRKHNSNFFVAEATHNLSNIRNASCSRNIGVLDDDNYEDTAGNDESVSAGATATTSHDAATEADLGEECSTSNNSCGTDGGNQAATSSEEQNDTAAPEDDQGEECSTSNSSCSADGENQAATSSEEQNEQAASDAGHSDATTENGSGGDHQDSSEEKTSDSSSPNYQASCRTANKNADAATKAMLRKEKKELAALQESIREIEAQLGKAVSNAEGQIVKEHAEMLDKLAQLKSDAEKHKTTIRALKGRAPAAPKEPRRNPRRPEGKTDGDSAQAKRSDTLDISYDEHGNLHVVVTFSQKRNNKAVKDLLNRRNMEVIARDINKYGYKLALASSSELIALECALKFSIPRTEGYGTVDLSGMPGGFFMAPTFTGRTPIGFLVDIMQDKIRGISHRMSNDRLGVAFSGKMTMSNALYQLDDLVFIPLEKSLAKLLSKAKTCQCDEVVTMVINPQEDGSTPKKRYTMVFYATSTFPDGKPFTIVFNRLMERRSSECISELFKTYGGNIRSVTTDAFAGYKVLAKLSIDAEGCWGHGLRQFVVPCLPFYQKLSDLTSDKNLSDNQFIDKLVECLDEDPDASFAITVICLISQLFRIELEAKEEYQALPKERRTLSRLKEIRQKHRTEESKDIYEHLRTLILDKAEELCDRCESGRFKARETTRTLSKSVAYMANIIDNLGVFLKRPEVEISTNQTENAIKMMFIKVKQSKQYFANRKELEFYLRFAALNTTCIKNNRECSQLVCEAAEVVTACEIISYTRGLINLNLGDLNKVKHSAQLKEASKEQEKVLALIDFDSMLINFLKNGTIGKVEQYIPKELLGTLSPEEGRRYAQEQQQKQARREATMAAQPPDQSTRAATIPPK